MNVERNIRAPQKGIWVELIGFDNTLADYGVAEYLGRMPVQPDFVSLLLFSPEIVHAHSGLEHDFLIGDLQCSYFGRPFNEERQRQDWTAFQLRGLVAELKKRSIEVFASFFDMVVTPEQAERHHVRRKAVEWIDRHPELMVERRDGSRSASTFCLWKHLADGILYEDFFVGQLTAFLKDYGFSGFHGSDGYGHPRKALCDGDFSDDMVKQFSEYTKLDLPDLPLPERAEWILGHAREAWSCFHAERHAGFWKKIVTSLKRENLSCRLNSCWTRDPFEALFRYGVDYRKLAAIGIDSFVVEASAAVCELEGWNDIEPDCLDQRLAAVQRLKAMLPDTPLVLLGATKDGMEQYDALRHAPEWMRSESYTLNNLFCNGVRCTEGLLVCLGDGLTPAEWRTIDAVHTLAFSGNSATPLPPGVHTVWSDRAFEQEFSRYATLTGEKRFPSSNTLLTEMLHAGAALVSQITVEKLNETEGKLPLAVFNPAFYPEEEWRMIERHAGVLCLVGLMRDGTFGFELREQGELRFCETAELVAPQKCAEPVSWLNALPEPNVRDSGVYARLASELNVYPTVNSECGAFQAWAWYASNKTMRILARNRDGRYRTGTLLVRAAVTDVRSLTEDPSLPVETAAIVNGDRMLTVKIPPHGSVILEADLE